MTARYASFLQAFLVLTLCLGAPWSARAAAGGQAYRVQGDCDGFPAVDLKVKATLCVGLVAQQLGFARGVAAIGTDVFVLDMGGWQGRRGRLWRLGHGGHDAPEVVLRGLPMPNALLAGPERTLVIGQAGSVVRIDPYAADPAATAQTLVSHLPTTGRHPLPALAWAADGALFVNVGSATDHCEGPHGQAPDAGAPCPETQEKPPRGAILRIPAGAKEVDARSVTPFARGLRNSMALALRGDGVLLAAVNARDAIQAADPSLPDTDFPHDTLVTVTPGIDAGWPQCFDDRRPSPEYPGADCRTRQAPTALLAAHAAPLGMLRVRGGRLGGLQGQWLISYHGYRATGHRLMAVTLDAHGAASTPSEVVGDWAFAAGRHPQGAPVGLVELDDGSVLITEDHNGTLLRLSTPSRR